MGGSQSKPNRVAILGGGPSGLTAAYKLLSTNPLIEVDIFESQSRFGGAIESENGGGFTYDLGPNSMNSKHVPVYNLLHDDLSLSPKMSTRASARRFLILKNGSLQVVPMSPSTLLKSNLLSWRAKLRVLMEPFIRKRKDIPNDVESVGAFFRRRFGTEIVQWLVDPAVAGIYSADTEQLAMKHAFSKVWKVEQDKGSIIGGLLRGGFKTKPNDQNIGRKQLMTSFNYDDGMHVFTDTLVEKIEQFGSRAKLYKNSPVQCVDQYEKQISSLSKTIPNWRINNKKKWTYDAIISTIPTPSLRSVTSNYKPIRRGFRRLSSQIPYAPVSVVVLGFDTTQIPKDVYGYGALIPSREARELKSGVLGVNFTSEGYPSRLNDKSKVFWTVYMGGGRNPDITRKKSALEIVQLATETLQKSFGVSGTPVYSRVKNWMTGIPTYDMKHDEALCTMARIERKTNGSVIFAGNYRGGVGVPDAILSGIESAQKISDYFKSSSISTNSSTTATSETRVDTKALVTTKD